MSRMYDMVQYFIPLIEAFIKGYCFYRFVEPFMSSKEMVCRICSSKDVKLSNPKARKSSFLSFCASKNKGAACGSVAYFSTILLFYVTRFCMDVYVIFGMASLTMFLVICQIEKRNYRQKAFLVMTFFSLNWFAAAMAEILYDYLYASAMKTDFMQTHAELDFLLYVMMCIGNLMMEFVFTVIGIWQVVRVYTKKGGEMEIKELIMLVLPSLMGLIGYEIMRYYRVFYVLNTGKLERTYEGLTMLYCAVSSITIIVVIVLYQDIKAKQEENQQTKLLTTQMESIRRHVEQVESLYYHMRSLKHDMTNHILTLERLYEGSEREEAKAYSKGLKAELAHITGGIESGNPVTNVILQEFVKEAGSRGISFHSQFYYPVDSNIDALDISVILNNALQNAVENTREGKDQHISIVSYQRNHAYMMEICNSFHGNLKWDVESDLPTTTKEKVDSHGYGLKNIRSVTRKYAGDIDITLKDEEFCLCIMLMIQ